MALLNYSGFRELDDLYVMFSNRAHKLRSLKALLNGYYEPSAAKIWGEWREERIISLQVEIDEMQEDMDAIVAEIRRREGQ